MFHNLSQWNPMVTTQRLYGDYITYIGITWNPMVTIYGSFIRRGNGDSKSLEYGSYKD